MIGRRDQETGGKVRISSSIQVVYIWRHCGLRELGPSLFCDITVLASLLVWVLHLIYPRLNQYKIKYICVHICSNWKNFAIVFAVPEVKASYLILMKVPLQCYFNVIFLFNQVHIQKQKYSPPLIIYVILFFWICQFFLCMNEWYLAEPALIICIVKSNGANWDDAQLFLL